MALAKRLVGGDDEIAELELRPVILAKERLVSVLAFVLQRLNKVVGDKRWPGLINRYHAVHIFLLCRLCPSVYQGADLRRDHAILLPTLSDRPGVGRTYADC